MKKSDTEQEQPGLEENKVPDSQSKRELDRELQELAENERQEEIYYEERRRERHERMGAHGSSRLHLFKRHGADLDCHRSRHRLRRELDFHGAPAASVLHRGQ